MAEVSKHSLPPPGAFPIEATMSITLRSRTKYQVGLAERVKRVAPLLAGLEFDGHLFLVASVTVNEGDSVVEIGLVEFEPESSR